MLGQFKPSSADRRTAFHLVYYLLLKDPDRNGVSSADLKQYLAKVKSDISFRKLDIILSCYTRLFKNMGCSSVSNWGKVHLQKVINIQLLIR